MKEINDGYDVYMKSANVWIWKPQFPGLSGESRDVTYIISVFVFFFVNIYTNVTEKYDIFTALQAAN